MRSLRLTMALGALLAATGCTTLKTPTFADDRGAIRGYDPVAYHLEQKPVKGDPRWSLEYNDATWFFSTEANRQRFKKDSKRYAPQYGGFCAYAMSKGYVVSTDPDAWTIVDDKLYLNYSIGVRRTWLRDIPGYVSKADNNWLEKISASDVE